ncbi:hypothetical protein [Spirosoma aerophilum]
MKKALLLWLILLPISGQAQSRILKKIFSNFRQTRIAEGPQQACLCEHLNTAVLFPAPPEISELSYSPLKESDLTIHACIRNLKSAEQIRLTLNGEELPVGQQTLASSKETSCPNGYVFSYTLTPSGASNTVSLEARNEGGATIRYLQVPFAK